MYGVPPFPFLSLSLFFKTKKKEKKKELVSAAFQVPEDGERRSLRPSAVATAAAAAAGTRMCGWPVESRPGF